MTNGITEQPFGATPLDADALSGLRFKGVTTHGELNEIEAVNIAAGIQWLDSRGASFVLLSDEAARQVHRRLFGDVWDWAGEYRIRALNIGVDQWQISTEMRYALDNAKFWAASDDWGDLEAAARFHHRLVWIHPFPNGNGRWARVMTDAYLEGINPDIFLDWAGGGDLQVDSDHRKRYIAALRAADGERYEPLLEFFDTIAT